MPFVRLILPLGAILFGTAAILMGLSVVVKSVGSDTITTSHETAQGRVETSTDRNTDPGAYWLGIGLMGGVPMVLGGMAVWWGRRRLSSRA